MCGRYGFTATDEELVERFDLESRDFELRDSYNVAPTHEMPVIERHSPNNVYFRKWGYYTNFYKSKLVDGKWQRVSSPMFLINAKAEKLMDSKVWNEAFRESRCIIPANYFLEWKVVEGKKQPILIRLKSKQLFGMAGLVLTQKKEDGSEEQVFVDITTEPNFLMEKIHARMTAILRPEDEDDWLNPDTEPDRLIKMLDPFPSDQMEAFPIDPKINSVKNNYKDLISPSGDLI